MKNYNLKNHYEKEVVHTLKTKLSINNRMAIPKLVKVVINRGIGESTVNPAIIEQTVNQFINITGQKPLLRKSKKSISNFKLRENQIIGCKVTLRRQNMYSFITKFIHLVCPKIRDFRGLPDNFDQFGNITFGLVDTESIFNEIKLNSIDKTHGLSITIVTSAQDKVAAKLLLTEMGFPFRNK